MVEVTGKERALRGISDKALFFYILDGDYCFFDFLLRRANPPRPAQRRIKVEGSGIDGCDTSKKNIDVSV